LDASATSPEPNACPDVALYLIVNTFELEAIHACAAGTAPLSPTPQNVCSASEDGVSTPTTDTDTVVAGLTSEPKLKRSRHDPSCT
jgi:hypothetical protein